MIEPREGMQFPSEEALFLVAPTGELRGERWQLTKDRFVIGRGPDCDLVVTDRQVSREHALIKKSDGGYFVEDLGSKNGTHLNGVRISAPERLQDGDEIQIAFAIKLTFIGSEATLPLVLDEQALAEARLLRMEIQAHRVWIGEIEVDPPLSPPQFRLLELLHQSIDRVVPREEIAEYVWPGTHGVGVSDQAIDALIRRLRDRLADVDPESEFIVTVRGHGFRLKNPIRSD
ncbi:MAG: FHA domain-containing protein [Anaerolineales bacterium]